MALYPPLQSATMAGGAYGPFVVSDITHYADKEDLEALLRSRFPSTAQQPFPWRYTTDYQGAFRVWAPQEITQEEKMELYRKNDARRGVMEDILSMRRYKARA